MKRFNRYFLILVLLIVTIATHAQEQKQRLISIEGGILFTYPRYNPSGKFDIKTSDSVINRIRG